jgi:hypothetical protein
MTLWRQLVLWLASLAADPQTVAGEKYACDAAVIAAYAEFAVPETDDVPPAPPPRPIKCPCNGTKVVKPDGTIEQPCPCGDNCVCKRPGAK